MRLLKVAAAALNTTPLDWRNNHDVAAAALDDARRRGVGLACLPELCLTGYGCEDAFFAPNTRRRARDVLETLLPKTKGMAASMGLPVMHGGLLFNAAVLCVDGRVVGAVLKQHLAGDGLHYEPRWCKAWPTGAVDELDFGDGPVPVGDVVFDVGGVTGADGGRGVRVGFEICEDAWAAARPGATLAKRGVDVILNPSASHFSFAKQRTRRGIVAEGSRAFGVTYVYSNLLGNEAGRAIYDGGTLIGDAGEVVAAGVRFGFVGHTLTTATVDLDVNRTRRSESASRHPVLRDTGRVTVDFDLPDADPAPRMEVLHDDYGQEEEFTRAVALGLFDYARKSHSRGFVVSLSGGADSAAVVALVKAMHDLGKRDLGEDGFAERMGGWDGAGRMRRLLTTAYQSTRNSGQATRAAAAAVAEAAGATHHELDVDELVRGYTTMIEDAIGRPLTWEDDDLTLQNIQARGRAPSVWMLANLENKLLLSTSNRSEAAVGYATMDGDTCGGISPIAGIDKDFLRQWLRWMEATGPDGVGPTAGLSAVNALTPTAELRPPGEDGDAQTDEADLMPYDLLDRIESHAIGDRQGPAACLELLAVEFPDLPRETLIGHVERFFQLWCRNQWKRERYAPSFHLDDLNLDPKTWCRFPILSGGFRRELEELE